MSAAHVALLAGQRAARGQGARFAKALLAAACNGAISPAEQVAWARPSGDDWRMAQRVAQQMCTQQITMLPLWALPAWVQQLPQPPSALFVRGNASLLQAPGAVAIVGSRRASSGPRQWARQTAARIASYGALIVSGGALGIDSAAHTGASDAGAQTLAFVGSAIDRLYPPENQPLFAHILASGGAIVSEHPPLACPPPASHARRNRLIAARCHALIVAEAAVSSGSMGAARYAQTLGVPVWVPPADIGGDRSGIDMLLMRQAARILPALHAHFGAGTDVQQTHVPSEHLRRAPTALQELLCSQSSTTRHLWSPTRNLPTRASTRRAPATPKR